LDKRLVEAVLATFRDPLPRPEETIACLNRLSWERSYRWLNASGMALYLLDRLTKMGLERAVPAETLLRLQESQRGNRARAEEMFREFVTINTLFQEAGVRYVNLKGISLIPGYCVDPCLRFQLDLDLLVESKDEHRCDEILNQLGYRLRGVNGKTREYKAGVDALPELRDMYQPKPQRSVEIHLTDESQLNSSGVDDRFTRAQPQTWNGFTFPALCEGHKFLAQAKHLFGHLRGEWTRVAWVLEYRNYVHSRRKDDAFWSEVRELAEGDPEAPIAIGMASRIAAMAFGDYEVPALDSWTSEVLPGTFNLWIERYASDLLSTDFPGSKLYLLLDDHKGSKRMQAAARLKKLLPIRRPPKIVYSAESMPLSARLSGWREENKYFWFRLRFHIATGLQYLMEAPRWRRVVTDLQR
jgi:hypothetical protein